MYQYGLLDVMRASPVHPISGEARTRQLTRMYEGLRSLETAPEPTREDWAVCADAVNMLETLVEMGAVEDASGLLLDAVTALAMAGRRHRAGHALRLDAPGIKAVRAVLEDYADAIAQLPARTVIQAHRATEKRIHDQILRARSQGAM